MATVCSWKWLAHKYFIQNWIPKMDGRNDSRFTKPVFAYIRFEYFCSHCRFDPICFHKVCRKCHRVAGGSRRNSATCFPWPWGTRDTIGCDFVFPLCIKLFWIGRLWSQVLGCKDHQDQASRWHGWELEYMWKSFCNILQPQCLIPVPCWNLYS